MPIFRSQLSTKSRFCGAGCHCFRRRKAAVQNLRPDGGGKVGIIIVFGFAMVPHWNFNNISAFPEAGVFFRDVLLTIPFCFFSAVFIQVLNPMNIAYRKRVSDRVLATRMVIRTHRISYITLIAVILFFSFSFTFSISHEEAVSAFEQNISALALAAQVIRDKLFTSPPRC